MHLDFDAEPLPEIPFPNDLAARLDVTSPTGLRLNFSEVAPTEHERLLRQKANRLTGFGIFAPIMVEFAAPLDLDAIYARHGANDAFDDDAVYVFDVTPGSPTYLKPVLIDIGGGRFPIDLPDRGQYFENDPRAQEPTLLFETVDEDLNGNGVLDPGEDTDNDGVLDYPNYYPEDSRDQSDLLSWYERETDSLIARPASPLREKTTYAVVLTERLVGLEGQPVRSPWESVNHTRQTDALLPAVDALEQLGLGVEDIAYAWTFTTAVVTDDLVAVRNGLHGEGVFASLAEDFPGRVEEAHWLQDLDGDRDPHRLPVDRIIGPLSAADFLPGGADSLIAQSYEDWGADLVGGAFTTPYFGYDRDDEGFDESDEWWRVEAATGLLEVQPQRVPFTCVTPTPSPGHQQPYPVVMVGHGQGGTRFQLMVLAWAFLRHGIAVCGFDFPGHGGALPPDEMEQYIDLIEGLGLGPAFNSFDDARYRDLNNDDFPDSGADFWVADTFHTRDNTRQAAVDFVQFARALRSCGQGTMAMLNDVGVPLADEVMSCDWDRDGVPDIGGADADLSLFGVSLGGINSSIAAAIEPDLSAVVPMIPGGGLGDGLLRSSLGGPREAVLGRLMTPLIVGIPDGDGLSIEQLVISVNEPVQIPVGRLPAVPAGGSVLVENLSNGEEEHGQIPVDGRFRVAIATDAASAGEKRLLAGMPLEGLDPLARYVVPENEGLGDRLRITILDAEGGPVALLDTFGTEVKHEGVTMEAGSPLVAASFGSGLTRQTPRFRRLVQVLALAAEPGDPIAYAGHWVDEPFEALGGVPRNVLLMPTVGDDVVPIATGVALARAAGFVSTSEVDPRYGETVDRWLLDRGVVHGYEELGPYTNAAGDPILFDVEDYDEGTDGSGALSEEPLRLTVETDSGAAGLRIVYGDPEGSHGWALPDPDALFDLNTYATTQSAWFLASRGQEIIEAPCFETGDCPFFRQKE
ncbi:MAG: hypothetical protein KDA24_17225 [Deltaproteobacteria bacterium]|nr:hypothetical protein [Deltaproteobacteria bacterium]